MGKPVCRLTGGLHYTDQSSREPSMSIMAMSRDRSVSTTACSTQALQPRPLTSTPNTHGATMQSQHDQTGASIVMPHPCLHPLAVWQPFPGSTPRRSWPGLEVAPLAGPNHAPRGKQRSRQMGFRFPGKVMHQQGINTINDANHTLHTRFCSSVYQYVPESYFRFPPSVQHPPLQQTIPLLQTIPLPSATNGSSASTRRSRYRPEATGLRPPEGLRAVGRTSRTALQRKPPRITNIC